MVIDELDPNLLQKLPDYEMKNHNSSKEFLPQKEIIRLWIVIRCLRSKNLACCVGFEWGCFTRGLG